MDRQPGAIKGAPAVRVIDAIARILKIEGAQFITSQETRLSHRGALR